MLKESILPRIRYFLRRPLQLPIAIISRLPYFRFIRETSDYQNQQTFELWFMQKILGIGGNRNVYWPVSSTSQVYDAENIYAGIDTCPGLMKGCYIQGRGGIWIGDYTQIAPNVIIVSSNHDSHDLRNNILSPVSIGKYCWIGGNACITPGITLGDFTTVAAGSVVTKSFESGYCLVAGNPAKKIRDIDKNMCVRHECKSKYNGYIRTSLFGEYSRKYLNIDEIFNGKK